MPEDRPVIVSACLAGVRCRYDGQSSPSDKVLDLLRRGKAILVCPEQLGGLPTPRPRHELVAGKVLDEHGNNATEAFVRGARQALNIARLAGCARAVLKSRSPSCGSGRVYDGTFAGVLVPGDGVFARMLKDHGLTVITENDL